MEITEIPISKLKEAPWNPNQMNDAMLARLEKSIKLYGVVENLVVRPLPNGDYEVLSGNQRLKVLSDMGIKMASCVAVELDDAYARLLAQALNNIQGEDDLGLRAEALKKILDVIPEADVLTVLPETANSLKALTSIGEETMATYLQNWQQAQAARLKHLQFQLTPGQVEIVEEALARILPRVKQSYSENPNSRGNALFLLCKDYLEKGGV